MILTSIAKKFISVFQGTRFLLQGFFSSESQISSLTIFSSNLTICTRIKAIDPDAHLIR